jgi:hypothetical protein
MRISTFILNGERVMELARSRYEFLGKRVALRQHDVKT